MHQEQEAAFWESIQTLDEVGILQHVMVIGSWAEYLFSDLFDTQYIPNIRTRDVDFFYRNISIPVEKVPLISKLKEHGFLYSEDPYTRVSRFYKEGLLELEFLTRVLGSGAKGSNTIQALGIQSEGLRELNILYDFACEIERNGYKVIVPEPSAYVIQKIIANPNRVPANKKQKDIDAVKELLFHIQQSTEHMYKLKEVYDSLSLKQRTTVHKVASKNYIELFL
jgi:hypothetical protein